MSTITTPTGRPVQKCWTCGKHKQRSFFDAPTARRCKACVDIKRKSAICRACGSPAGLTKQGEPRKYCDAPECQAAKQRTNGQPLRDRFAARTAKRCPACGLVKPLVIEHWSPKGRRRADGTVAEWDGTCTPCRAADQRQRYSTDEERRRKAKERAKANAKRVRERRLVDSDFNERYLEQRRAQSARQRARRKQQQEAPVAEVVTLDRGEMVPSAPLAAAILNEAGGDVMVGLVCERIGVDGRRIRAWRSGEFPTTTFGMADKVLIGLDLLWWEVYPPDVFPQVARIFDPEAVAA